MGVIRDEFRTLLDTMAEGITGCLAERTAELRQANDHMQSMQEQLTKERRAMERQWKEREKQIDRVMTNTVGMYGSMQGIIGGQLPEIASLEFDDGEEPGRLPGMSGD